MFAIIYCNELWFPKSAQALFLEFLLPLIIAYSHWFHWCLFTFSPSQFLAEVWLRFAIFCPKKPKRYQMRYQIWPRSPPAGSGAPARNWTGIYRLGGGSSIHLSYGSEPSFPRIYQLGPVWQATTSMRINPRRDRSAILEFEDCLHALSRTRSASPIEV